MTDHSLRVLESVQQPRPTTNPYITMLISTLQNECDVTCFSWKEALTGSYDVFHVHWPEVLIHGGRKSRLVARRAMFAALLLRLKLQKIPVVRTIHNRAPHEDQGKIDRWLLKKVDDLTTQWIRLNRFTPEPDHGEITTILLGNYLNWFEPDPDTVSRPKQLLHFGAIRRYKGTITLLKAFRSSTDSELRLTVAGSPHTPEIRAEIEELAADDARIKLKLTTVPDDELARELRRASLVVLPYKDPFNTSALITALSLNRPVLVPANNITAWISEEVGPGWVLTYRGDLTAQIIAAAVASTTVSPLKPPDLSQRDWTNVGELHYEVFVQAAGGRRVPELESVK